MKRITNADIRKYRTCYDPNRYFKDEDTYTVLDLLNLKDMPIEDKLWVVLRTDFISERTMRLFAVWSYRQTLAFVKNPDPRSIEAANVAERFANEKATVEELKSARSAAMSAAESYILSPADYSFRSAAWSAAESSAWAAYESATWSSARHAAWSAALIAARSAAWSAVESYNPWYASKSATWSSGRSAAESAQENKLRDMIINGVETGDTY